MGRRLITMNAVVEMIYQWHQGHGLRRIRDSLGFNRKTVRRYVRLAKKVGVDRGLPFPDEEELLQKLKGLTDSKCLRETPGQDLLNPHREWIKSLLEDDQMTAKQVWRLFQEKTDISLGYCTVKRYLKREFQFGVSPVTVRIEVEPGSQAQVDFGYAGLMHDPSTGKDKKSWAFIMTLSCSRHRFVRFVFKQGIRNWIDCHIRAFEFFGGVPATIVLDNLRAGVVKPDIYDPILNRAYAELERHYGFFADPAKVRKAQYKGKVERTVPVVRKHLLAGREFKDIDEANERALNWCRHEIGMQIHGTTKRRPYEVFTKEEAHHLSPLPPEPFECPEWKECTVHNDHHIVFDQSYYSVPTRFIGKKVWVRGGRHILKVFLDGDLIKVHTRAEKPGTFMSDQSDYPTDKTAYLYKNPEYCVNKAKQIGPSTERLIRQIISVKTAQNLRKTQAILRLSEKYSNESMEKASKRALDFGNTRYRTIKTILEKGLYNTEEAPVILSAQGQRFLRPPEYFSAKEATT